MGLNEKFTKFRDLKSTEGAGAVHPWVGACPAPHGPGKGKACVASPYHAQGFSLSLPQGPSFTWAPGDLDAISTRVSPEKVQQVQECSMCVGVVVVKESREWVGVPRPESPPRNTHSRQGWRPWPAHMGHLASEAAPSTVSRFLPAEACGAAKESVLGSGGVGGKPRQERAQL